jgi:hypothetical protein
VEIQSVMLVFSGLYIIYVHCETGGGGWVMWRAYSGAIHWIIDQIPNLRNCFATPKKDLGGVVALDPVLVNF